MAKLPERRVEPLFVDGESAAMPLFTEVEAGGPPEGAESLAPLMPPPPAQMTVETAERVGRAIAEFRRMSERAAGEIAANALEIGVLLARRIIEAELATNPETLRGLVLSAVRRLGDVHKVTVHLSPGDVEAVTTASGEAPFGGLGIAKVELVADTNLTPGDCVVESDAAKVDGRIGTRLEELRAVLANVINVKGGAGK